ncbi:MAG: hypothetical protein HC903_24190 [Methylacidiphilales bacterium]|nr:hypothetical protein [Candidatus Methylacidiphilales bacterium]
MVVLGLGGLVRFLVGVDLAIIFGVGLRGIMNFRFWITCGTGFQAMFCGGMMPAP